MNQTSIQIVPGAPATPVDPVDQQGFEIGWDHARHGLVPPAELLLSGTPVSQGWLAGKATLGKRTLGNGRYTRLWLQLRMHAWRMGLGFEGQQLTPNYLAQLQVARCPVTRAHLQGAQGAPGQRDTLVVARLNPDAAFAAGNLAVVSQAAAERWDGLSVQDCVRQAHQAQADAQTSNACAGEPGAVDVGATREAPAAQWWRLAALRSYATPLPFAVAAGLPMAVLPPNRVRLLNAVQGLQALLTRSFCSNGWSERCRRFASWLPEHSWRMDFNLFVGAMAPRVLEAGDDAAQRRLALEDAWLNERVQRRWQHFVLTIGEAAVENLLDRATAAGLSGVRTVNHPYAQATEGWALPAASTTAPSPRLQAETLRSIRAWPTTPTTGRYRQQPLTAQTCPSVGRTVAAQDHCAGAQALLC